MTSSNTLFVEISMSGNMNNHEFSEHSNFKINPRCFSSYLDLLVSVCLTVTVLVLGILVVDVAAFAVAAATV